MDMNDNELIREGIKNSLPGDEIVIESKNEAGREVKTYMALGEEDFKKSIISPVDEKKKSIRIGQYVVKGSEIMKEIAVVGPSAKVYWNRRKLPWMKWNSLRMEPPLIITRKSVKHTSQ